LGEFSPIGRLFTLASIYKNLRRSPNVFANFFNSVNSCINVYEKMGWATFWAIFSQTHLVTLIGAISSADVPL
jgi:hypothetical protein